MKRKLKCIIAFVIILSLLVNQMPYFENNMDKVEAAPTDITSITLTETAKTLQVGHSDNIIQPTYQIQIQEILPETASQSTVQYITNAPSVATVNSSGLVTAVGPGTATITVRKPSDNSVSTTCTVTVLAQTTVDFKKIVYFAVPGQQINLANELTITPSQSLAHGGDYTSGNDTIAKVAIDTGMVTCLARGTVNITFTSFDKRANGSAISNSCQIIVNDPPTGISVPTVNPIQVGQSNNTIPSTRDVTIGVLPSTAYQEVIYSISPVGIATISSIGNNRARISALATSTKQTATITVSSVSDPSKTDSFTVDVLPETNVSFTTSGFVAKVGETIPLSTIKSYISILPDVVSNQSISFSTKDTNIAHIGSSDVVLNSVGTTTLIATIIDKTSTGGAITATCTLTVNPIEVGGILLGTSAVIAYVGKTTSTTVTVSPASATVKTLSFVSSAPSFVTATAVSGNKININVTTDQSIATQQIEYVTVSSIAYPTIQACLQIIVKPAPVEAITFTSPSVTIIEGRVITQTAIVGPSYVHPSNNGVTYSSTVTTVASVNAITGEVTAIAKGTTIIKATSTDGSNVVGTYTVNVIGEPVTSIILDVTSQAVIKGTVFTFKPTILPNNADNKALKYISSNSNIVRVEADRGIVEAVGAGVAIITATAVDGSGVTATCSLLVKNQDITSIFFTETNISLGKNNTRLFPASVLPTTADNKVLNYKSSNPNIVTITSDGTIKGIEVGTATISAVTTDGSNLTAECLVRVVIKPVASIRIEENQKTLALNQSFKIEPIILPEDASNKNVKYQSSDPKIATVDTDGKVTAVTAGAATIIVTTVDGTVLTAVCNLTVTNKTYKPVASVILSTSSQTIARTGSFILTASAFPEDATDRTIKFTTSDPSIATVSAVGTVMGLSPGTVNITAKAMDGSGKYAVCKVTVSTTQAVHITSIVLDTTNVTIMKGNTYQLYAFGLPFNAVEKSFVYSTNNGNVARVSATGLITGIDPGTATITVTAADSGTVKATCTVSITPYVATKIQKIILEKTAVTMEIDDEYIISPSFEPADATDTNLFYTSSNDSIASVDEYGYVTAKKKGSATITATATDGSGVMATLKVTVIPKTSSGDETPMYNVSKNILSLNCSNMEMFVNKTFTVKAIARTVSGDNPSVYFKSSNSKVAKVNGNGLITGIGIGITTITAYTDSPIEMKRTFIVFVKQPVTQIKLNATSKTLKVKKTFTIKSTIKPSNATVKAVTYKSSNTKVATVSSSGKVTAKKKGTATITVTAKDGSKMKTTIKITVK